MYFLFLQRRLIHERSSLKNLPLIGAEADLVRCSPPERLGPLNKEETALTPALMNERLREPSDGLSVTDAADRTVLRRRGVEVEGREAVTWTSLSAPAVDGPGDGSVYRSLRMDLVREGQVTGRVVENVTDFLLEG